MSSYLLLMKQSPRVAIDPAFGALPRVFCSVAHKSRGTFLRVKVQKAGGLLGVTSRGLLILIALLLIILLLFVVIVVLAAMWPRSRAQEAPRVCDTPACLRSAAQVNSCSCTRPVWRERAAPLGSSWQRTCTSRTFIVPAPRLAVERLEMCRNSRLINFRSSERASQEIVPADCATTLSIFQFLGSKPSEKRMTLKYRQFHSSAPRSANEAILFVLSNRKWVPSFQEVLCARDVGQRWDAEMRSGRQTGDISRPVRGVYRVRSRDRSFIDWAPLVTQ